MTKGGGRGDGHTTTHWAFCLRIVVAPLPPSHPVIHTPLVHTHVVPPSPTLKHTLPLRIHMCFLAAAAVLCIVGLVVCVNL